MKPSSKPNPPRAFLLVAICFFCGFSSMAEQLPFSSFGYPETTALYGPKASTSFYFKFTDSVQTNRNTIHLEIVPSQLILKEISTITFNLGDQPIYSAFLKQFGDTIRVDLPIQPSMVQQGFVKLEILSNLFLRDEECRAYDEPGLWLNVTPNSYLQKAAPILPASRPNWTIDQFLPEINHLILSKEFSVENPDLATYLHYYFKKYQSKNLQVSYLEDSLSSNMDRAIFIGSEGELTSVFPEEKISNQRTGEGELKIIYKKIPKINSQDSVYTTNLLLTGADKIGWKKAIQFLLSREMTSAAMTDQVSIFESVETESIFKSEIKKVYTFADLGLETELSTGLGKIIKNIPLPNYLAQGRLKSLVLNLEINHKPITDSERAYVNIYLNNDLAGSFKLDESGIFAQKISPKNANFGTGSYIGIEYIYVPEGGLCDAQVSDFYAQINPKSSTLFPEFYDEAPLTFSGFPRSFDGARVEILHDYAFRKNEFPILSDLLIQLNRRYESETVDYLPEFVSISTSKAALDSTSNKILLLQNPQALSGYFSPSPYVEFLVDSISYRSDEIDRFFDLQYQNKLAFVQLFGHNGNKVMMISNLTDEAKPLETALSGLQEQFFTNTGNVLIANDSRYYFFDLRNNEVKNETQEKGDQFDEFWNKFRLFIIIIVISLIVVLLSYIFNKSKEAKKKIEDARR